MPIITPTVEDPDELLAWPGPNGPVNRIQIERSDVGGGAGYANIGSVVILPDTRSYTFYDPNGDNADWYRWYFSNAANSFPILANRSYSPELQPGDETDGLICSIDDVEQELEGTLTPNQRESVLEKIRQVTTAIIRYTGRLFVRDPLVGTTTFLLDVEVAGGRLYVPEGIAEASLLEVAPYTGGAFTVVGSNDWALMPRRPSYGWTHTWIDFADVISGPVSRFEKGWNTVRVTGARGWPEVPADIQGVAIRAIVRRHVGKGGGGPVIAVGPKGTEFILPDMSGADRAVLDSYRIPTVA